MAEAHSDAYLSRKMTRDEYNELSVDEKRERILAQRRITNKIRYAKHPEKYKEKNRKYRENNPEKIKEKDRKYYETNKEKVKECHKEYSQSPTGKKVSTLSDWKRRELQESPEELDRIYEIWLTQELCYSCECKLTRTGKCISTDACMDHCHTTNRFRQICCNSCNSMDNWKKYWVDGIFGGLRPLRPP
jgi:hypothetical protein